MTVRRISLGLILLAAGAWAGNALLRTPEQMPETGADLKLDCDSCDARHADKQRLRDYLKSKSAETE